MTISGVTRILEKINSNYKTDSFIRRQIVCRALWIILVPIETIALICQIAKLVFIDFSTKPILVLLDDTIGLPERVSNWANEFEGNDTVFNVFVLVIGTTSTAFSGFITPSGNYELHKNISLTRKKVPTNVKSMPIEMSKKPTTPPAPELKPTPAPAQMPHALTLDKTPEMAVRVISNQPPKSKPPSPEGESILTPSTKEFVFVNPGDPKDSP